MQKDEGQIAKKGDESDPNQRQGDLLFRFPNTWRLKILDRFYNFAAFVPVDDQNSITYIRAYQRFIGVPLLDSWLGRMMMFFNKRVLGEDRRVVCSQDPIQTQLAMDEMLVQGDRPIIEFRRRMQDFLDAERLGKPAPSVKGKTNGPRISDDSDDSDDSDISDHPKAPTQPPPSSFQA